MDFWGWIIPMTYVDLLQLWYLMPEIPKLPPIYLLTSFHLSRSPAAPSLIQKWPLWECPCQRHSSATTACPWSCDSWTTWIEPFAKVQSLPNLVHHALGEQENIRKSRTCIVDLCIVTCIFDHICHVGVNVVEYFCVISWTLFKYRVPDALYQIGTKHLVSSSISGGETEGFIKARSATLEMTLSFSSCLMNYRTTAPNDAPQPFCWYMQCSSLYSISQKISCLHHKNTRESEFNDCRVEIFSRCSWAPAESS